MKKVLSLDTVRVGLPGESKDEIIENLVDLIVNAAQGLDRTVMLSAVKKREAQMSTGIKNGIAIPHGKTDHVTELHAAAAVSAHPVDFESLDKKPARIFIMTVSPAEHTGPHLQFLAEVSSLLNKEEFRNRVLAAKNERELLDIFLSDKN